MLEGLLHLFSRRAPREVLTDVLDLLVVTYIVYRALLVMRGTRAMQMGTGLGVIFLLYVVSKWAGLVTLFNLLSTLLSSIILIVVVVFQNDIRRGLMRVGSRAFFAGLSRQQESRVIDEVVGAATELARHRIGALICFEQDANLDEFVVGQGTVLDAAVQKDLMVSLFLPDGLNKLHDGAVIIRNLRVAKAGVFFPMPDLRTLDKSLGSRHRAALGITEETDAVVVVVSEERGTISFCFNGNIVTNLDGASLRQALLGLFGQRARKKKAAAAGKRGSTPPPPMRLSVPGEPSDTGELPPLPPPRLPTPMPIVRPTDPGSARPSTDAAAGRPSRESAEPQEPALKDREPAEERPDSRREGLATIPPPPAGAAPVGTPPEARPPVKLEPARPMAPAKPLETPKPIPAEDVGRPRETEG